MVPEQQVWLTRQQSGVQCGTPWGFPYTFTFFIFQDVGCKPAFIPHIGGVFSVFLLDDILQVMVNLCSNAHGFPKVRCTNRQDHELLHGQLVASVRTTVDDIESLGRDRGVRQLAPRIPLNTSPPRPTMRLTDEALSGYEMLSRPLCSHYQYCPEHRRPSQQMHTTQQGQCDFHPECPPYHQQ